MNTTPPWFGRDQYRNFLSSKVWRSSIPVDKRKRTTILVLGNNNTSTSSIYILFVDLSTKKLLAYPPNQPDFSSCYYDLTRMAPSVRAVLRPPGATATTPPPAVLAEMADVSGLWLLLLLTTLLEDRRGCNGGEDD